MSALPRRASPLALLPLAAAAPLLAGPAGSAAQQEGGDAAAAGPVQIGAFVLAQQDGRSLLVTPDTASSLQQGTRLFFRCSGDRREVYVASSDDRLGDAEEGAGGRYRFDDRPWSDLHQWGANESGSAAFLPPRFAPNFADRARSSDVLEIEIVNTAGVRHAYVFRLDGFGEGADRLRCFDGGEGDDGEGDGGDG